MSPARPLRSVLPVLAVLLGVASCGAPSGSPVPEPVRGASVQAGGRGARLPGDTGGEACTWYDDDDDDGWGDPTARHYTCTQPWGTVANCDDCDDRDASVHPGAPEEAGDEVDQDCDGTETCLVDGDGDGWAGPDAGPVASPDLSCREAGEAPATVATDCDDADPSRHPGAPEPDCDDPADLNCDGSTGHADQDGDGHAACQECDDDAVDTYPGAPETCDGRDQDCDGSIDDDTVDAATWYADQDGDGYGDPASATRACQGVPGLVEQGGDCDDADPRARPGGYDVPDDGIDQDCDGTDAHRDAPGDDTSLRDSDTGGPREVIGCVCGCAAAPADGGGAWIPVLLGLVRIRRRRTQQDGTVGG